MNPLRTGLRFSLATLLACSSVGLTQAQQLGPDFVNDFTLTNLLQVPGVPSPYGGLEFKAGDPNKLLITGFSEDPLSAIYEIDVTRDAQGHVDGFTGIASVFANAPQATGGLKYGPGGVLFFTTYPDNTLRQFLPGSTTVDKVVDLGLLGAAPSTGGLAITPSGFPGAGELKITSYNAGFWYSADLVPDGMGTFDVANMTLQLPPLGNGVGPESIEFVDSTYPAFANQSVLICEWTAERVSAYEIDANGDPINNTRRDFVLTGPVGDFWPQGSTLDPMTGDFLFSDWGSGDSVIVIQPVVTPIGTNYCLSTINSSGFAATIAASGSASISANDLVLGATGLPINNDQPGTFLAGPTQATIPFFDGFLCVAPNGLQRFAVINVSTNGTITEPIDYNTSAAGGLNVVAGMTYNYQRWNRDPAAMGLNANFSDGLAIVHTP